MTCTCICHTSSGSFRPACDVAGGCGANHADEPETTKVITCIHPRCRGYGPEESLRQPMCAGCHRFYRRQLDWLVLDYVTVKSLLPKPAASERSGKYQSPKAKTFGHPAEWASDMARDIADMLNWIEDGLRNFNGHQPPPHPGHDEARRVGHAHKYLVDQFDRLCDYDAAEDSAIEITDMHGKARGLLGLTRQAQHLPVPCPWCDMAALTRSVDVVTCGNCNHQIKESHYEWFSGYLLDRLINDYDTAKAQ